MEKINILISIDNNYVEQAIDMMYSLSIYNENFLNVYLIYNDLSDESINKIAQFLTANNIGKLKPYYFDIDEFDFPIYKEYISITTYLRLFAPFIISDDIDRLLYLDCDIICRGEIIDFYNTPFENNILVACPNLVIDERKEFNIWRNIELGLPEDNCYVNAGVLLININKYREFTNIDEIFKFIEDNYQSLYLQDQDIINKMFYQNIKLGNIKYNYQISGVNCGEETGDNCLIHYSEEEKPWSDNYRNPQKAIDYYNFLKIKGDIDNLHRLITIHSSNQAQDLFDYIMSE